jgi:hypothetical protein
MTLCDIYNAINDMIELSHDIMYKTLVKKYSKTKVEFVMYDMFEYINITIEEREKRKDAEFKKRINDRYNNECIISGTDLPCQVCHIKPFKDCSEREKYDIDNGIILRNDIHTLFDIKEIKINPDTLLVEVSDNIMKNCKRNEYHRYNNIKVNINTRSIAYLREIYD